MSDKNPRVNLLLIFLFYNFYKYICVRGRNSMSKKKKLTSRLQTNPKDFTFEEAKTLLKLYGYTMSNSGKTSGSRVHFVRNKKVFRMHKPHPNKELLAYQIKEIIEELKQEGLI